MPNASKYGMMNLYRNRRAESQHRKSRCGDSVHVSIKNEKTEGRLEKHEKETRKITVARTRGSNGYARDAVGGICSG